MAQSLRTLKGVGEKTEKLFQKVGIYDTDDLLHYYPRNYDEYETPVDIAELKEETVQAVSAAVCSGVYVNSVRGRQIISVNIADQSGKFPVVWFNLPYLKKTLRKGSWFVFRGWLARNLSFFHKAKAQFRSCASRASLRWNIRRSLPRQHTRRSCITSSRYTD